MRTRTANTAPIGANSQSDAAAEPEERGSRASYTPQESELWIFDGIDDGAVPYEISLPHPRTGRLSTFAIAPKNGVPIVGEIRLFKSNTPASFVTTLEKTKSESEETAESNSNENEVLVSKQDLRVVTEIDPIFLLLPMLAPKETSAEKVGGGRGMFITFDDWMDKWKERSSHAKYILDEGFDFETASGQKVSMSMAKIMEAALDRCCDNVMAGDETMYRYSEEKLFTLVLEKAQRMVTTGLPPSLEDMAERAVDTSGLSAAKPIDLDAEESAGTPGPGDSEGSQVSKTSSVFSQEETSVASKIAVPPPASSALDLMRLRLAISFILSNYVPPPISKEVLARLDAGSAGRVDFTLLRNHLEEAKARRAAWVADREAASMKRRMDDDDDDEKADERAEKKRKRDEEEKKRRSENVSIKALRKVDTRGMQKLSAFFTSKPKTK